MFHHLYPPLKLEHNANKICLDNMVELHDLHRVKPPFWSENDIHKTNIKH